MKSRESAGFLTVALVAALFAGSAPGAAQTVVPVPRFRSIVLRGGGELTLRHGPTQGVTLVRGSLGQTRIAVVDDWLAIDTCVRPCPPDYSLEIEIAAPDIAGLAVQDGGTIESRGTFPPQPSIDVAVEQGGTIDIRSLPADAVDAAVTQGGLIFTRPRHSLAARVAGGGIVTYWGDAVVQRSIRQGGLVVEGAPADAGKPLRELRPAPPPIPPIPPVPPVPPAPPAPPAPPVPPPDAAIRTCSSASRP